MRPAVRTRRQHLSTTCHVQRWLVASILVSEWPFNLGDTASAQGYHTVDQISLPKLAMVRAAVELDRLGGYWPNFLFRQTLSEPEKEIGQTANRQNVWRWLYVLFRFSFWLVPVQQSWRALSQVPQTLRQLYDGGVHQTYRDRLLAKPSEKANETNAVWVPRTQMHVSWQRTCFWNLIANWRHPNSVLLSELKTFACTSRSKPCVSKWQQSATKRGDQDVSQWRFKSQAACRQY